MAWLCWVAIVATTGCSTVFGLGEPQPAPLDAPPASCVIAGFDLCAHQQPNGPIHFISDTVINTSLDCNLVLFDPEGGSLCIIYATDLDVTATVTAYGPRPLVLAATGTITIDGAVDVSSSMQHAAGAGSNHRSCAFKQSAGRDSGGGAGGSFHGMGGAGGNGTMGASGGGQPSDPIPPPSIVRGGCPGQASGFDSGGQNASGGAVLVVASTAIVIGAAGRVLANGQGGSESGSAGQLGGVGGSGAGSGGLIEIVAPSVTIAGIVSANGGGGSEGADLVAGKPGNPGTDGGANAIPALGGAGNSAGGDGGNGGAGNTLAATGGMSSSSPMTGGGGGGGGAGFVVLTSSMLVTTGGTISPPSS